MSTIFLDDKPRKNPTIRVRYYRSTDTNQTEAYLPCLLLEFHPSFGDRAKCRGVANVRPELWMTHDAYKREGVGYLEPSEQYVPIREFSVHRDDVDEMMHFCARQGQRPLIVYPCPRPFPFFHRGERVTIHNTPAEGEYAAWDGSLATVYEESSQGGQTRITFDTEEYNEGLLAISIPSKYLRLATDLVRSAEYNSLMIAPLWRYYEAARESLKDLESIAQDADKHIDWSYIEKEKKRTREAMREFEARFPDYRGIEP